ncbi:hypothetical protein BDZ94DRAFT_1251624 [Collybia nuda]|uniref:Uncharacterized protein n=1 Tax=Collybia nuda TaxID=64659 RepID=A0A9P6CHJ9_9AGAR|nr:hypothetical protein BDZ94DRAFT_1251624 [Collybia nuda]
MVCGTPHMIMNHLTFPKHIKSHIPSRACSDVGECGRLRFTQLPASIPPAHVALSRLSKPRS